VVLNEPIYGGLNKMQYLQTVKFKYTLKIYMNLHQYSYKTKLYMTADTYMYIYVIKSGFPQI